MPWFALGESSHAPLSGTMGLEVCGGGVFSEWTNGPGGGGVFSEWNNGPGGVGGVFSEWNNGPGGVGVFSEWNNGPGGGWGYSLSGTMGLEVGGGIL